jgi:hypothetical protein
MTKGEMEQLEDKGKWSITKAAITIEKGGLETALHELGHADQAARRPLEYKRQAEILNRPDGRPLKPAERPVERYADLYAKIAGKEIRK